MTTREAPSPGRTAATDPAADPGEPPRPAGPRWLFDPRLPATWTVAGLLLVGGWQIGGMIRQALVAYPVPGLATLCLFALYAVPFVLVVRAVDFLEREPPALLAVAFAWGGVVATSLSIPANAAVRNIVATLLSPGFADTWSPAISAPLVEEILKALGVVAVVLLAGRHLNNALDGFVYGAMVGLGFQVVEDIVYAINAIAQADTAGSRDWLSPLFTTFLVRGFLGGLWSHTMFTALAGAGIGYAVTYRHRSRGHRLGVAALAFAGAWGFHFVWNTPLLLDGFGFGLGGVLAAVAIKGVPGFVVVVLLVRAASHHEAVYYADLLKRVSDLSLVTPEEIPILVKGRNRLAARRHAYSGYGAAGAAAVRRLHRAQARFAVELSRQEAEAHGATAADRRQETGASGTTGSGRRRAALRRRADDVRRARRRLNALGIRRVTMSAPVPHSWSGAVAIGLGLAGVVVPWLSFGALGLGLAGRYLARRRRVVADSWFTDALMIGGIGLGLWVLSVLIFGSGGR